jgi:hypothetical protein
LLQGEALPLVPVLLKINNKVNFLGQKTLKLLIYIGAGQPPAILLLLCVLSEFLVIWISPYIPDRYFKVFVVLIVSLDKNN